MIVALFAFNWRAASISTVAGLVSVAAAVTVLYVFGVTINVMIIAGFMIALSAIIDDAIIDIENIVRRLHQHRREGTDRSTPSIILEASLEMRRPILYATLIMVLAVAPALFLEGVSGAFYQPLIKSYMLALLASFVVALTVTPTLSLLLFRKVSPPSGDTSMVTPKMALRTTMNPAMSIPFVTEMLRSIYNALFSWAARTPRSAFVVVCAFVVAGLASAPKLRQESLLPNFKETDLVVRWQGNSGASHPAMSRIAGLASRELRSVPGVLNVSAHVGRAVMSDKRTGINAGELWVSLDPTADYDETVASVKQVVASYPGLSPEVLTYLQAKVRKELSGTGDSLVVRVYGEDMNTLRKKAEDVNTILSRTAGIVESKVQYPTLMPTLEIEVDMDKANRYGLKPGDVRRATTTLVSGIEVGSLFEEQKVFDVMVYGTPGTRRSLTAVQELLIDTPSGGHVRLKDVADMRIVPAAAVINRDAVARRIDVTANVRGRDLGSVGDEIEDRLQEVEFPLEYRAELLGEYAERDAAEQRVLAFVIAAAIGIFLLLQAYF
ncbi:MAG: efflux RND transporter permease subunit, partial [Woeseiaceae bacterium]